METINEPYHYQWIANEGLLRDEGTLFGIAGAGIQEKIEAIRDYYRIKKAPFQTRQEQLGKKIRDIKARLSESSSDLDDRLYASKPSNLIPVTFQLLIYSGICLFNYWLVIYWLSPVIHIFFICLGIYLFGLFSVFIGRSIMYNPVQGLRDEKDPIGQREKWKVYLEEFGVPLIVSLFITILPARHYPIEYSIIAVLFFFMLFLFGGKGFINSFFRARKELTQANLHLRHKKEIKEKKKEVEIYQNEWESSLVSIEELNGEEEYKILVFTSEYKLAFESRQLANGATLKKLA